MTASEWEDINRQRLATIKAVVDRASHANGKDGSITEREASRMFGHIVTLQDAEVPLKRIEVKEQ